MGTKITIPEVSSISQEFAYVRLPNEGIAYIGTCFSQSLQVMEHGIVVRHHGYGSLLNLTDT
jgi:hypothetical protein